MSADPIGPAFTALPEHLAERLRPIPDRPPAPRGELVLYWMHHAVRGHENPALDAARHAALALGLPLLVYQGLAGRHRFNADRHHAFILEGARDAHAELAGQGIRAVFHLPADPAAPSPLPVLAARAALVVTEDFPAPPFPAWTERLAARVKAPVWRVDCACVLPMRLHGKRFERAFEFRPAHARAYAERVPRPWPVCVAAAEPYAGELAFTPAELADANIAELCARCDIDHSLPPVPHTRGGSRAGYARWDAFRSDGLAQYHRLRNDAAEAWPRGVSRLSPYVHHGQVSPLRIAREAAAAGGEGAEKFLDELLIWRELAHNWCFHTADPEAWEALPRWARDTLAAHAQDPRERALDSESLARAQSDDRLWDLAQRSLLVHGELHNNLRMTWAKAIPHWTESPERALAELIDLNHRHALDGSDPNSYGGLLWALGLFDRPFPPERPVTGTLRIRPTADHARRLHVDTYAARVSAPAAGTRLRIAVVGAGVAGLAAARTLADQNHVVTLFEKSRGRGGRAATRRIEHAGREIAIDHGAQYFTARDPRFRRRVESWVRRGVVAPWAGRFGAVEDGGMRRAGDDDARFVGVPGMSTLGRMLADGLDLRLGIRVAAPERAGDAWLLRDDTGAELGRFDRVLIAAPAPQAVDLLAAAPALAARAAGVDYAPCWTVLAGFDGPVDLPRDGLFVNGGPLGWVARNTSKPGRTGAGPGEVWVLHGAADFSRAWLEAEPAPVMDALLAAFADLAGGTLPALGWSQAQRWRFSFCTTPLADGCLWDAALGLGACGDWCAGARIEAAWLSGEALAGHVLGSLAADRGGASPH
ncbi:NAD(P)-binding protein [Thiohalocapsa sp. ML1]|uniref:NAD(P)-binding protein n=1 Tax=Thiohalocapsa sp. ML1 TaxID=1431688 RepID=UPI000AD1D145|nr:NAD(P)-binding protein [Thiohalocapsa sp. ML1]